MENLYLVCLIPPASIVEDVDEIRNYISDKFGVYESLKRPAHITLYPPVKLTSRDQEQRFFTALEQAAYSDNFNQILRNFGSFLQHTFYIDVEKNDGIINLEKQIRKELNPIILSDKKTEKFNPHLTLAFRDIKPPVFEAIATEFKDRKFKREFAVSSFSVHKHSERKWRPFRDIAFKNPELKPKPLSLFD